MAEEIEVRGIIISTAPNGEYGRRARLLTDKLGLISVFAQGAAKQSSRLIGSFRPMSCAVFRLQRGRGAYNVHGIDIIEAFTELTSDFEHSVYAMYVLETGEYLSAEGMPENEAKALLNLMYVSLSAIRENKLDIRLIISVYRLRLLILQGEYTTSPPHSSDEAVNRMWRYCISCKLSQLYAPAVYDKEPDKKTADESTQEQSKYAETDAQKGRSDRMEADADKAPAVSSEAVQIFMENADWLFARQIRHSFRSLEVLKDLV